MRSLSFKLIGAMAAAVLVALGVVIVAVTAITARQFDLYVTRSGQAWSQQMSALLAESYAQTGDWSEAEAILENPWVAQGRRGWGPGMMEGQGHMPGMGNGQPPAGIMGDMWHATGLRFVLADADGTVVADTGDEVEGQRVPPENLSQGTPIQSGDQQVGTLLVVLPNANTEARIAFLGGVIRAVMLAAVAAGGFALLVGALLSRRITQPLRQLRHAAHSVAAGDLDVRVPVPSDDELGEVAGAFNQMAERLSRQQQLRQQMVADIAHELRTPVSVLQGTLEAMIDGVLVPSPEEMRDLHGDVRRLARLVEDLRTLSLADAGQLTLERGPVDVAALLEHLGGRLAPLAVERGITLSVEAEPSLPSVSADEDRLAQVLTNLIDNALRHTPSGGQVSARARQNGDRVELEVVDTGPGIPPEDQPYLFERFWRGDRSRSRESGGSGLGLAIVRQLVDLHGGSVSVESQQGAGSVFRVSLPLQPV